MSSRHLATATEPDPERAPLSALPGLYADLTKAVLSRLTLGGRSGFGSALPIRAAVHDLLRHPDHLGHLGIVPGLVAMERVTRLALGDSLPDRDAEHAAVARACRYLSVQMDRLLHLGVWGTAATGELATVVDEVLSRIDVERVKLDWELSRRRAGERVAEIDATVPETEEHYTDLEAERASCVAAWETDYIDFEGALFDAITARFLSCANDPFGWYGFVVAETAWMVTAAEGLLGLAEHSQRRIVQCPMCEAGWVGLAPDPDMANCDSCGREWTISDGKAEALFGAFRAAGWTPRRVA